MATSRRSCRSTWGSPRIYADNDLDGECDLSTILETDELDQVDRGAFEAGCWAWHMQTGFEYIEEGQKYRLGFHDEIDDPSTITLEDTLSSYALERAAGNLDKAFQSFGISVLCAATITHTRQANQGMLDAVWEQATGAMLEGNELMVQSLDVTDSQESVAAEIALLHDARQLYDEATRGYLEPIASDVPGLLETLAITRTHPITYTTEAGLVDLERLVKASASKSRAALELAERQFRDGQDSQAEQSLREGAFQATAEMALLYRLWPDGAETVDYAALIRNLGDMNRLFGYMAAGKNPLGYDADFIPFSYHPAVAGQNNYIQTQYIADGDLDAAGSAVTAAEDKQREVDDDYEKMQTRLSEVRTFYDGKLVELCGALPGGGPDREHCSGGDIQEQLEDVENAMLHIERVLQQMENQNALIRIEEQRVAAEVGIRNATARLITSTGEELANLAKQEVEVERKKSTVGGHLG